MPPATPVVILLYERVSAFEANGALAALRAAGWDATLAAAEALVRSREGARLVPDQLGFDALARAEVAILPGGDATRALRDPSLTRGLRERRGHFTLASGDAIRLLHAAGLTAERRIARMPGDAPIDGAQAAASRLVADGRLLTCFAGDAIIDLVLHHVGHEDGIEVAKRAAAAMGREWQSFALGQKG